MISLAMRRPGRLGIFVLAGMLTRQVAHAEGGPDPRHDRSTGDRIYGVATLLPTAAGLVAIGGHTLRRLPKGARRWQALHTVAGDNLYRVAADESGRLLASWSREKVIHVISPDGQQRISFPKPEAPPDVQNFEVSSFVFLPQANEALVFATGTVRVKAERYSGSGRSSAIYRVVLDGKSRPTLLSRIDRAFPIHLSPHGGVFAIHNVDQKCDARECSIPALVAIEVTASGVNRRTLLDSGVGPWSQVRVVRGSDRERVEIVASRWMTAKAQRVSWRYGDARPTVTERPAPGDNDTLFLTPDGKLLEFRVLDGLMELRSDGLVTNLGELQKVETGFFGVGRRANGSLWFHWGDHIGLYTPGQPPRAYGIGKHAPRRGEWAGADIYDDATESLWVGIDDSNRHFVRVSLTEADRGAKPWPPGKRVERTHGEYAGYNPKDASTADRLYNAAGLRPAKDGVLSVGGAALRQLPHGSKRWQTLLAIPGDNLYRADADERGRILAAWEKDPNIHLFRDGEHVTFAKPTPQGPVLGDFNLDDFAFLPNGREALITMTGQVKSPPSRHVPEPVRFYYSHWGTEVYRVSLDGVPTPRLLYREDFAHRLQESARGTIFAMPKYAGQQCEEMTCMPITEIVAYEVTDTGIKKTSIIRGDAFGPNVYLASATMVSGSDDRRVAMVLGFTRNDGKLWRGSGRALLRWRWGEEKADRLPLPGHSATWPKWLLTRDDDFIEIVEHYDQKPDRLELKRYLAKGGEHSTMLTALTKMATMRGLGERANGGLWLHWGEHLWLVSPGQPSRSYDLDPFVRRGTEWAGAYRYVPAPEALWVGLDGRGRSYFRVDLGQAESKSRVAR